jgi:predicted nuclease of predicted toxin-antitoxin system
VRLLADECFDRRIVEHLRARGHDVVHLAQDDRGSPDTDVAAIALREGRVLLTEDKDFGELVVHRRQLTAGVVLLRRRNATVAEVCAALDAAFALHSDRLSASYCVVDDRRSRLRALDPP